MPSSFSFYKDYTGAYVFSIDQLKLLYNICSEAAGENCGLSIVLTNDFNLRFDNFDDFKSEKQLRYWPVKSIMISGGSYSDDIMVEMTISRFVSQGKCRLEVRGAPEQCQQLIGSLQHEATLLQTKYSWYYREKSTFVDVIQFFSVFCVLYVLIYFFASFLIRKWFGEMSSSVFENLLFLAMIPALPIMYLLSKCVIAVLPPFIFNFGKGKDVYQVAKSRRSILYSLVFCSIVIPIILSYIIPATQTKPVQPQENSESDGARKK